MRQKPMLQKPMLSWRHSEDLDAKIATVPMEKSVYKSGVKKPIVHGVFLEGKEGAQI